MKIINVAGARPNFPKIAPIMRAMEGKAQAMMEQIMDYQFNKGQVPQKWDGKAAERIVRVLKEE